MLTYYKNLGYNIQNYPDTYDSFSREISLPVFYSITEEQIQRVINAVISSVEAVLSKKMVG